MNCFVGFEIIYKLYLLIIDHVSDFFNIFTFSSFNQE